MVNFSQDYLLNKKVIILQPLDGYRASSDAVLLSSAVAELKPADSVLDVGSGTGAVSLCLAHRFPSNLITGLELQPELVSLSHQSRAENHFKNLTFIHDDIREKKISLCPGTFDHVITNPPYSDHDVPSPNASKAAAHNHQNFNLSSWLKFCLKMLKPFGHLYLIHRVEALTEIISFLNGKAGAVQIIPIYSKPGQKAKRIIVLAQKDSKAPAAILPPLYIRHTTGEYTAEADKILREGISYFSI